MVNAIIMNEKDTVVTVTKNISSDEDVTFVLNGKTYKIKSKTSIPIYHKVAIKNMKKGEEVIKYGERIGYATKNINIGEHVHTHNIDSKREENSNE